MMPIYLGPVFIVLCKCFSCCANATVIGPHFQNADREISQPRILISIQVFANVVIQLPTRELFQLPFFHSLE